MILTPEMWEIKQRLEQLALICMDSPGDYVARFELEELKIKYRRLDQIQRLGLKLIMGGKQASNPCANRNTQIS